MTGLRSTARRWMRRIKARARPNALILMYHRVADLGHDPLLLAVTPAHFAEHLTVLARHYRPLSLLDACQALQQDHLPRRSVVITFDDGYADNLYHAQPILQLHQWPATVFVTTGPLLEQYGFWWDELAGSCLTPGEMPSALCLTINGQERTWRISAEQTADWPAWNVLTAPWPSSRQALFRDLLALLRPLAHEEQQQVITALYQWRGQLPARSPTQRVLTTNELRELAAKDGIGVGAHTHRHPVLANLPASAQSMEIETSRERLKTILGRPITTFAYPFGSTADYTTDTCRLLEEAGVAAACTTRQDLVWAGTPRLQLPRMVVRDWSGEQFARTLAAWFAGAGA
ncbi:MAG: polysaccharide deacetylase family protein [Anaerolineales bacterium]|nr:polysaccharide deacetylase family protein [Anaerolineales bacterium]